MIALFCTIQRTCIVTQISLIQQEKSPNVRSWIHLEFTNNSVGLYNIQLEFRLNSGRREPSWGPGFEPLWRTFFSILGHFSKVYFANNFCQRKSCRHLIPTRVTSRSRGIRFCCQKHFFFPSTARLFACTLVCSFALGRSLLAYAWPWHCAGLRLAFREIIRRVFWHL